MDPASAYDGLTIEITGYDTTHIWATFDKPGHKIDIGNAILESEAGVWADNVVLKFNANFEKHDWEKKLELKKWLDKIWESGKKSAASEVNKQVNSFAEMAKDAVENQLRNTRAIGIIGDAPGLYTITDTRISEAGTYTYQAVATAFADFVKNNLWDDVPISDFKDKKIKESWDWNWKPSLSLELKGGNITLNPGVSEAWEWIQSVNDEGFTSKLLEFKKVSAGLSVSSDGNTAQGKVKWSFEMKGSYGTSKGKDEIRFDGVLNMSF